MALTMQYLTELGIDEAAAEEILGVYRESLDGLAAEALTEVQAQRDALLERVAALEASGSEAAAVQQAFDAFRQQVAQERSDAEKTAAMRRALRQAGVQREEFIDLLMEHVDLSEVAVEQRQVRDAALLIAPLRSLYGGCFATQQVMGAPVHHPLQGGGGMTREDILAIRDASRRQQAIAEHHELFGY